MTLILIPSAGKAATLAESLSYGVIGPVLAQFSTVYRHNTIIIRRF
jgi:hypothetical protein